MANLRCLARSFVVAFFSFVALASESGCRDESKAREVFADNYHGARVTAVAFSPTVNVFASAGEDDAIHLFDATDIGTTYRPEELRGSPLRGHGTAVTSLGFSPDSAHLAAGNFRPVTGGYAQLWTLSGEPQVAELAGSAQAVHGLAFSRSGEELALAVGDFAWGGVYLASLDGSHDGRFLFEVRGAVSSVAFSQDGARLAAATQGGVVLWDFAASQALTIVEEGFVPQSVVFDPVRPLVLYAAGSSSPSGFGGISGVVMVFDLEDETSATMDLSNMSLRAVACSALGELLAAAGDDNAVYVVNAQSGALLLRLWGHYGRINSLSFSKDSTLLVSGSDDKFVRVWYVGDLLGQESTDTDSASASDTQTQSQASTDTMAGSESGNDGETQTESQTESYVDTSTTT
ncbi:MAG: hypothetical protein MUC50_16815 [Myxococcota bacterium]|nr:hypothetical protein [Myxococcota bacterium]